MAKSTVKVKHLGVLSTGKFMLVFCFILSILYLLVAGAVLAVMMLFSMLLGASFCGVDTLLGMLMGAGIGVVGFIVGAVVLVIAYSLIGCIMGMLGAFAFNLVAKLSGGLSFDAEIA